MAVCVRQLRDSDIPNLAQIFNHPEVIANICQLPFTTEGHWRARLATNDSGFTAVAERDGAVVGSVSVEAMSHPRRKHVAALAITVDPAHHGQGIGTALMREAVRAADAWLNVQRIELGVYSGNRAAIALYRNFGFQVEGEARNYAFGGGRYQHLLHMARLSPPTWRDAQWLSEAEPLSAAAGRLTAPGAAATTQ